METIAKIISSLKENEKSIIFSIIANSIIFYLFEFLLLYQFKNYLWHQELLFSLATSLCYTITFYLLSIGIPLIFNLLKSARDFYQFVASSSIPWYNSVIALAYSSTTEFILYMINNDYVFGFDNYIVKIGGLCLVPSIVSFCLLLKDIFYLIKKK